MTDEAERQRADQTRSEAERRARLHARLSVDVPADVARLRRRRGEEATPSTVRLRTRRLEAPDAGDAGDDIGEAHEAGELASVDGTLTARPVVVGDPSTDPPAPTTPVLRPFDFDEHADDDEIDGRSDGIGGDVVDSAIGSESERVGDGDAIDGSADDEEIDDGSADVVDSAIGSESERVGDGDAIDGSADDEEIDDGSADVVDSAIGSESERVGDGDAIDGSADDEEIDDGSADVVDSAIGSESERVGDGDAIDGSADDEEIDDGSADVVDSAIGSESERVGDGDAIDGSADDDVDASLDDEPTVAASPVDAATRDDDDEATVGASVFDGRVDADDDACVDQDPETVPIDEATVVSPPATTKHDQRPWWRKAIAALFLVTFVATGVFLAAKGTRIVRDSTEGKVLSPVDDPTAPGFVAFVDPTPTLVFLHHEGDELLGVAVLTLPDNDTGGGGVVLLSPRTVADLGVLGRGVLADGYFFSGGDFVRSRVSTVVGTGILELAEADEERIAALVEPVAPLVVDNPDRYVVEGPEGEPEVRFESGVIELEASDVHDYLRFRLEGESELAHMVRVELFWNAWIDAIAASPRAEAVPGETATGLGRFLRVVAGGTAVIETLPVVETRTDFDALGTALRPVPNEVDTLMAPLVPLPVSSEPGARVRVRVLNGTSDTLDATAAALSLTPAGAEIAVVGNASAFGVQTTTIEYVSPELADEAEALREVLGVGLLSLTQQPSEVAEITITLGADYGAPQ